MEQSSVGLVTGLDELQSIVDRCRSARRATAFDIETGYHGDSRDAASLHPEENFMVGISLTNSIKWSRYVPLGHSTGTNLDPRAAAEILYPLLVEDRDEEGLPLGVAHGGRFELRVMRPWFNDLLGTDLDYTSFVLRSDSLLESYVEATHRSNGLKELTEEQAARDGSGFWHKQLELEDLFPDLKQKEKKQVRFNELHPHDPKVIRYACEDTIYGLAHHRLRWPKVKDNFIFKLEMSCLPVVCAMEDEGLWYDWNGMREWGRKAHAFADLFMEQVRADFGALRGSPLEPQFNFGSPVQLGRLLYEDCGMPIRKRTKTGRPGTDAKVALKQLSKDYPEVAQYLGWKKLTKLHRDFLERFEDMYSFAEDGRSHPSLLQHGVPAGRFAHKDPNYAQSPKKYKHELRSGATFEFNFREMIGAPPGWYMLGFDLAQAELRAVAGLAGETKMFQAFLDKIDVHSVTASLIFGVPIETVTKDQRDVGKTMGLALTYGLTESGLADRLGITVAEAEDLFAAFHAAYPRIKEYTEKCIKEAQDTGFVHTAFGRRVRIWDIDSSDRRKRREAQRTAGNAPVQGSGTGDYMKVAMVRADKALREAGMLDRVRLVMNVHDALEWYVRDDVDFNDVIPVLEPAVVFPVKGWPPMFAEWHAGRRWGSVRDLEQGPDGRYQFKKGKDEEPEIDLSDEDDDDVAPASILPALEALHGRVGELAAPAAVAGEMAADQPRAEDLPGADHHLGPAVPVPDAGPPRTVVVKLTGLMPQEAAPHLVKYCRLRPGPNTVVLRIMGEDITMTGQFAVGPADEAEISLIVGGAQVFYDESSVDLAAIGAGLEL